MNLKCDGPLSNFGLNFNLRRYITGRTRLVLQDPANAVGVSPDGGLVFGAGPDFAIHPDFHAIDCELGTTYASRDPLTASALKELVCGGHLDGGGAKLHRFEAWLVPFNTPDQSLTEDENTWLNGAIGGDVPLNTTTVGRCKSTVSKPELKVRPLSSV